MLCAMRGRAPIWLLFLYTGCISSAYASGDSNAQKPVEVKIRGAVLSQEMNQRLIRMYANARGRSKAILRLVIDDLTRRNMNPDKFYAHVAESKSSYKVELLDEVDKLDRHPVPGGGKGDSQVCTISKGTQKIRCLYYQ